MRIEVRFFASVREALGDGGSLTLPASPDAPATVDQLRAWLAEQSPEHAEALAPGRGLRMALDQALCDPDARLHDGAEVAFFPPVTGG